MSTKKIAYILQQSPYGSALSLYDIEQVYACNDSLTLRGVSAEQLSMDVDCLDKETFENTLRTHDIILSF